MLPVTGEVGGGVLTDVYVGDMPSIGLTDNEAYSEGGALVPAKLKEERGLGMLVEGDAVIPKGEPPGAEIDVPPPWRLPLPPIESPLAKGFII